MKKDFKILSLVLLLFTVLSLLLFWPVFTGKVNLNGNLLVSFYAPYGENLPFKNSGWDQLRIYFPFYKITLDAIKNLQIPLWNPYAFSGHPHLADFQTAVFYPLNIFGLILGQVEFWHLLRITPMILASFFTFLYLRNLRLANLASFFGALTFGFSPFILTWGEEVVMSPHSVVWLPLILLAIDRFLETRQKKFLALISVGLAFSFFGGYMQTSIYLLIFVAAYLVFRLWQTNQTRFVKLVQTIKLVQTRFVLGRQARILASVGSVFLIGVGISAVQLLPSAELYFNAARSEIALREQLFNFLLPIESLFTYLAPDFFGHPATHNFFRRGDAQYYEGILFVGVAALIFAAFALLKKNRTNFELFWAISGLFALATTLDTPAAKLFLSLPIPFLSTSIANRVLFIPALSLAVLAAIGLEKWQREKFTVHSSQFTVFKAILIIAGAYAAIFVGFGLVKIFGVEYFEHKQFLSQANLLVTLRNLVIPILVFATVILVTVLATVYHWFSKQTAAMLIIALSFLHLFYFSQKYFAFSDRSNIFPENSILRFIKANQGYFRSWGVGSAFLENNFASQYGIFWPEGYDSLNNRAYGEFTYAMQGADIAGFVFRADAGLGRGETAELLANPARRRLIDMVGVKYVIGLSAEEKVMSLYDFQKVFSGGKYAVYENLQVMPRAFLASNYEGPPDIARSNELSDEQVREERRKLIFNKLSDSDFDWRNVLILEKPSPISPQFGEGAAQIVSYKPQEVIVKTRSDQPKLLFLSDNYYPGWKATVDGDETEILRADYTFRAVPLLAGEHEVRFYYDSLPFKLGLMLSLVSLVGLGFLLINSK